MTSSSSNDPNHPPSYLPSVYCERGDPQAGPILTQNRLPPKHVKLGTLSAPDTASGAVHVARGRLTPIAPGSIRLSYGRLASFVPEVIRLGCDYLAPIAPRAATSSVAQIGSGSEILGIKVRFSLKLQLLGSWSLRNIDLEEFRDLLLRFKQSARQYAGDWLISFREK